MATEALSGTYIDTPIAVRSHWQLICTGQRSLALWEGRGRVHLFGALSNFGLPLSDVFDKPCQTLA